MFYSGYADFICSYLWHRTVIAPAVCLQEATNIWIQWVETCIRTHFHLSLILNEVIKMSIFHVGGNLDVNDECFSWMSLFYKSLSLNYEELSSLFSTFLCSGIFVTRSDRTYSIMLKQRFFLRLVSPAHFTHCVYCSSYCIETNSSPPLHLSLSLSLESLRYLYLLSISCSCRFTQPISILLLPAAGVSFISTPPLSGLTHIAIHPRAGLMESEGKARGGRWG